MIVSSSIVTFSVGVYTETGLMSFGSSEALRDVSALVWALLLLLDSAVKNPV